MFRLKQEVTTAWCKQEVCNLQQGMKTVLWKEEVHTLQIGTKTVQLKQGPPFSENRNTMTKM